MEFLLFASNDILQFAAQTLSMEENIKPGILLQNLTFLPVCCRYCSKSQDVALWLLPRVSSPSQQVGEWSRCELT